MKITRNEKLIARNGKIGQYALIGSMIAIGISFYVGTQGVFNEKIVTNGTVILLFGCVIASLIFSQISSHLGIRYGRSPRPDEKLDAALKGLHSEFSLHHYSTPASHFLLGPAGAWVLLPYHHLGQVTYTNGRWRLKGGGFLQGYMRLLGQDGLGRPDADAKAEVQSMQKFLAKKLDGQDIPEVRALIVFTGDKIEVDADEAPIPVLKLKQLKEFIRRESRDRVLTSDKLSKITEIISPAS